MRNDHGTLHFSKNQILIYDWCLPNNLRQESSCISLLLWRYFFAAICPCAQTFIRDCDSNNLVNWTIKLYTRQGGELPFVFAKTIPFIKRH